MDTERLGALGEDVSVGKEEGKHQLPLLGFNQQTKVDVLSRRKWRKVAGCHQLVKRPQYLLHPSQIVENEAGARAWADLQLDRVGNIAGQEGELNMSLYQGPQSPLSLLLWLSLVSPLFIQSGDVL